jgi:hypothetical protein
MIALLSLALATEPTVAHVHGWEDNGHFVVETQETSYGQLESDEGDRIDPNLVYGDRYDVWGVRHRTLIRQSRHSAEALPGPINELGWSEWLSGRTFSAGVPTRQLTSDLTLSVRSQGDGSWAEEAWTYHGADDEVITLGIGRSSGGWWPVQTETLHPTAFGQTVRTIHTYPSPDGRWLAVYLENGSRLTMRGVTLASSTWSLHQIRPLVSVLAPDGQSADADTVAERLNENGNGLLQTGTALTARETTTIFFKPGFKSDAERMARRIRGDEIVEPMTWDGPQDIVIALGPPTIAE